MIHLILILASLGMAWFTCDLPMPLPLIAILFCVFACWNFFLLLLPKKGKRIIVRLKGITWTAEDYCRGWLFTGVTGAGKPAQESIT